MDTHAFKNVFLSIGSGAKRLDGVLEPVETKTFSQRSTEVIEIN
jgi:hypothetical protein